MPRTRVQQWKKRLREIVELWLVPIGSALLPRPLSRRLLWRLSRFRGWYFEEAIVSVRHAEALGVTTDAEAFWRRLRFRLLVEHMDCFWCRCARAATSAAGCACTAIACRRRVASS